MLGYNPLSASCDDRLVDILDETGNFDIVLLAGSGRKFENKVASCQRVGFSVYSCGYGRSPLVNQSCGVVVACCGGVWWCVVVGLGCWWSVVVCGAV